MRWSRIIFLTILLNAFVYGGWKAYEYTEQPEFCNLCHGVEMFYKTWTHSAHQPFTNCQSCHIPQDIRELYYTPRYGIKDAYFYFIGDTPDFYRARPPTPRLVRENCLRCHETLLRDLPGKESLDCVHCHRHTPHQL